MLGISDDEKNNKKRKGSFVRFKEEDEIINPEDVDPNVGRFRNLVQTSVIPHKKQRTESSQLSMIHYDKSAIVARPSTGTSDSSSHHNNNLLFSTSLSAKLGIHLPNPAPDVDLDNPIDEIFQPSSIGPNEFIDVNQSSEPKKKKYAKEAWPGKKQGSLLI